MSCLPLPDTMLSVSGSGVRTSFPGRPHPFWKMPQLAFCCDVSVADTALPIGSYSISLRIPLRRSQSRRVPRSADEGHNQCGRNMKVTKGGKDNKQLNVILNYLEAEPQ